MASLDTEGHPECAFQVDSTAAPGAPLGTGKGEGIWTKRGFVPQFDAKSSTKTCLEAEGRSPHES